MRAMNKKVLANVLKRPHVCARAREGGCSGRMTIEHVFGRKMEAEWNCIWLCWHHHLGPGLNKEINKMLAYRQITEEELLATYKSGAMMVQEKRYLEDKYTGW